MRHSFPANRYSRSSVPRNARDGMRFASEVAQFSAVSEKRCLSFFRHPGLDPGDSFGWCAE
jgi:hypothetical protein